MTSLRGHGSPVPTQTSFLSRGEIAIAPIDCVPALSKTGAQSVPPFVDRHTPPPAAPAYSRFGSRSVPATVATRPPETAGPIARQVIVGPGVGEGDGEAAGEALGAGEAGVSGSAASDGEQANAIAAAASGAIRRSVRTSIVPRVRCAGGALRSAAEPPRSGVGRRDDGRRGAAPATEERAE